MKNKKQLLSIVMLTIMLNVFSLQALQRSSFKVFSVETEVSCLWRFNGEEIKSIDASQINMVKTGVYSVTYTNLKGELLTKSVFYNAAAGTMVELFVIGDSTASYYSSGSYPRTGWAQVLQPFFNEDSVKVVDKALSGRSSKSFYTDPAGWPVVKPQLNSGDYLFIQFGHNDAKSDEERHTDPYTTYKEYLTKYITEARAAGAIPLLLTPINRNGWRGAEVTDSHGEYDDAMRELAVEVNVPLIDLTIATKQMMEDLGQSFTTNNLFMNLPAQVYPTYPDGSSDNTHLQERGAFEICKLVMQGLEANDSDESLEKLKASSQEAGFIKVEFNAYNIGSVTGAGVVPLNEMVKLTARPSSGYVLDGFYQNGDLVHADKVFEFEMQDTLLSFQAVFVTGYKVNLSVDPKYKGRATGSGTYAKGDSVTVVCEPYTGYQFVNWTLNDDIVSTDPSYIFVMDTINLALVAHLELENTAIDFVQDDTKIIISQSSNQIRINADEVIGLVQFYNINGKLIHSNEPNQPVYSYEFHNGLKGIVLIKISLNNIEIIRKIRLY